MKEAVAAVEEGGEGPRLDMHGLHRVHTLFSGTSLLTVRARPSEDAPAPSLPGARCLLSYGYGDSQTHTLHAGLSC